MQPAPLTISSRNWARFGAVAWAAFLACSWTWCIGMFLPVLLVRDYGPVAWLIFAVPNIIGAAAMGWVLRDQEASGQFLARNAMAAVAFSAVTIAFHFYFVCWVVAPTFGHWTPLLFAAFCTAFLLVQHGSGLTQLTLAILVFVASLVLAILTLSLGNPNALAFSDTTVIRSWSESVYWLLPACCFGFALCPYLDLTFHRVRQSNNRSSARIAFGLGFGLFFLLMILYTLCYANPLAEVLADYRVPNIRLPRGVLWIVMCHLLMQSAYTVALHLREIIPMRRAAWRPFHLGLAALMLLLPLLAGAADWALQWLGMPCGELGYRLFMVFYGLIFPAYVYYCSLPAKDGQAGPSAARLALLAIMVVICVPLYWMAFIGGQLAWLGAAVAMLIGVPWATRIAQKAEGGREEKAKGER